MSCGDCKPGTIQWAMHGAVGVAKAVLGIDRASNGEIAARRDVCRVCPHSTKHPNLRTPNGLPIIDLNWCRKCLCNLRAKSSNAEEECCDKRWGKSLKEKAEKKI